MSRLGIQMYTLRKTMDTKENVAKTLERVAAMGYRSVQITTPSFMSYDELAKMLRDNGISADSAMVSAYQIPDKLEDIVKQAEIFGTDVVRTDSISKEQSRTPEGYHDFAKYLNQCGEKLADRGLKFMYHFHAFEFINFADCRGMDILLAETDPQFVMFQPDVFWLTAAGTEASSSLRMFEGRAKYMHLKDYSIAAREEGELEKVDRVSSPVGTGNLNWPAIIKTAHEIGITNFVAEDDMGLLDPFESARISLENMKKMGF